MLAPHLDLAVRQQLLDRLGEARRRSDSLFEVVRLDALYDRPIRERHRIIFYAGHLEAFDWNLLDDLLGLKSFHPEFDRLFAFGIDPVGGGLPTDRPEDWPSLEAVRNYVTAIRTSVDGKLADATLDRHTLTRDGFPLETLLNVAIEHRLMHVETLSYMLHQLPLDKKIGQYNPVSPVTTPANYGMVGIPSGTVTLGLSRDHKTFGWDNEYQAHIAHLPGFEIDRYKITNGQYLDFMAAGGYEMHSLWSDEDWKWREERGIRCPVFWRKSDQGWIYRGMFEEIPLPLDWPVYVSHAEAMAYARWAGKALPTEEEWQRAAYGTNYGTERWPSWDEDLRHATSGNFDFARWDPAPVNASDGISGLGVHDIVGNGWEWTSTVFGPFRGFEPFPFYRGYSADFFDGKHFVMKGGSARTAACMLRPSFRNWFQAHYQYVYAGFRCVNR
jgi:gamma-glutamyl hercynylcysteine S-oxide synthase